MFVPSGRFKKRPNFVKEIIGKAVPCGLEVMRKGVHPRRKKQGKLLDMRNCSDAATIDTPKREEFGNL